MLRGPSPKIGERIRGPPIATAGGMADDGRMPFRPIDERTPVVQPLRSVRPASAHRLVALGILGLAGTIAYPYAVAAVQMLQDGYDGSSQAVSQLVHGQYGALVAVSAGLLGAASLAPPPARPHARPPGGAPPPPR